MVLRHGVQCTAVLKPFNLRLVESVGKLGLPRLAVFRVYPERNGLTHGEFRAHQINPVVRIDLVVIGRFDECQRKHALLLQVCLVLKG